MSATYRLYRPALPSSISAPAPPPATMTHALASPPHRQAMEYPLLYRGSRGVFCKHEFGKVGTLMNIATPLRFCAALALLLGGSSIASAAAPTSETSINPKGGSVLVFTDLHSAAVPEA